MSEKTARTHSHVSNRARNNRGEERKVVFKAVLDNPFRIQWPPISPNAQKDVLDAIIEMLSGVAAHNVSRKRKRTLADSRPQKKRRVDTHDQLPTNISSGPTSAMDIDLSLSETTPLERPPVLKHLVIGINEVTKRLEQQIRALHSDLISTKLVQVKASPPLRLIAVCRADIDPPILVDHLPHLVAAFNSLQPEEPITLVSLQAGAETLLSQAVGLRRAAVLGFDLECPNMASILDLLKVIPTLSASWLAASSSTKTFVATHIKQVRTSAPKDMKAAKQNRKEEKTLRKQSTLVNVLERL